jgi:hypothetical protein
MRIPWYKIAKLNVALRKHVLRVDLCVFVDKETAFSDVNYLNSTIKSLLTASIVKGLDIVGIISEDSPSIGLKALQLAAQNKQDIKVIPGQTYKCADGEMLYVYKLQEAVPKNLTIDKACSFAHERQGFVIAANITKRQAQNLEKLQGSIYAPDAVEIFNDKTGGFKDLNIDYQKFISSGSTSANELEESKSFTLVERKKLADMGLLGEEEMVDYIPKYLQPNEGKY